VLSPLLVRPLHEAGFEIIPERDATVRKDGEAETVLYDRQLTDAESLELS